MTDDALRATAAAWLQAGRRAAVVEAVEVRGSAPCTPGTRMLVAADAAASASSTWPATTAGTVGGGHLEWQAMRLARDALGGGGWPAPRRFALGPSLGQCCGGAVTLAWRALDAEALRDWPAPAVRWPVELHGAGHVARALVPLLATLPVALRWIDVRDDAFAGVVAGADVRCLAGVDALAEVDDAPPNAHVLVMTHRHDLDFDLVDAALRRRRARGDVASIGVIGSATKAASMRARLRERGHDDAVLTALRCPIGVEALRRHDAKAPALVALAVAAELAALALDASPAR